MKPFSTIAIPHKDILEGRFTMDVFAADLWEVFKKRAPAEYQDPDIFFGKSYITSGLNNLLEIVKKRLEGKGGDSVIQLQTPFGGGKTHSLIALYHKAKEWKANTIVIDGTALDPKETTIWEEMERQLTGGIKDLKGKTSPGKEKLRKIFEKHQPLLILMDEILEYTTKASGISLTSQILAFVDELSRTVRTLDKTLLVITLPSSILEHYDESAERLFQQLQKIIGRMERIYTPVQEEEIADVIRKRLFSSIEEKKKKEVIEEFLDYAEKEKILPEGMEKSTYRDKFLKSYPFQPEVINILYKRWGSFPTFQRTRGVLRLLSLVIYSLKDSQIPYVRLADFDLTNTEIKRELIKHIGQEYDSVISADITLREAGAKKVDKSIGDAYSPFSFGTKVATAIFLYSFSGGPEKGATTNEIKLSSCDISCPSSIIVEVLSKLRENLFFLQTDGKLFFTNQPNLNRILLTKVEGISDEIAKEQEKSLLVENLKKEKFEIFLWPENPKDVPDTKGFKLIVLQNQDRKRCKDFLENYGERPRVFQNILIFLCPKELGRKNFEDFLKKKLAWQLIGEDKTLTLTSEQKKEIQERIKKMESETRDQLRNLYRIVLIPSKEDFKEIDLGIPTFGTKISIDREIYDRLRTENEILESLAPLIIREKYLKDKEYVETKNMLISLFTVPGEIRIASEEVFKDCIKEGVKEGLFGLGDVENGSPLCRYFRSENSPQLIEGEIILKSSLCKPKEGILEEEFQAYISKISQTDTLESLKAISEQIPLDRMSIKQKEKIQSELKKREEEIRDIEKKGLYTQIFLKLQIPFGKLSGVGRILQYLKEKFREINVKIDISAQEGKITPSEYEDKVKEAISQANIEIEEEKFK